MPRNHTAAMVVWPRETRAGRVEKACIASMVSETRTARFRIPSKLVKKHCLAEGAVVHFIVKNGKVQPTHKSTAYSIPTQQKYKAFETRKSVKKKQLQFAETG